MSRPVQETIVCTCGVTIRKGGNISLFGLCDACKKKDPNCSTDEVLDRELVKILGFN